MATVSEARQIVAIAHAALASDKVDALTSPRDRTLVAFTLGLRTALSNPETIGRLLADIDAVPGKVNLDLVERFNAPAFIDALKEGYAMADEKPDEAALGYGLIALAAL